MFGCSLESPEAYGRSCLFNLYTLQSADKDSFYAHVSDLTFAMAFQCFRRLFSHETLLAENDQYLWIFFFVGYVSKSLQTDCYEDFINEKLIVCLSGWTELAKETWPFYHETGY